ncbi:MAG: zinc-ribbon domain-containing protein, partial [Rhodocyclaceae bacterium]|nr:zinc-ribbon domain-containing protein [Rhodocyclaceae bacterium]
MMLTRCPACETSFRVRPEQLQARQGRVRCGHCSRPFNALESLVDEDGLTPVPAERFQAPRPEPDVELPGQEADPEDSKGPLFVLEETSEDPQQALPIPEGDE